MAKSNKGKSTRASEAERKRNLRMQIRDMQNDTPFAVRDPIYVKRGEKQRAMDVLSGPDNGKAAKKTAADIYVMKNMIKTGETHKETGKGIAKFFKGFADLFGK